MYIYTQKYAQNKGNLPFFIIIINQLRIYFLDLK